MNTKGIKHFANRVASVVGYPGPIRSAINSPVTHSSLEIADSSSIARGAELRGNITIKPQAFVCSKCTLRGDVDVLHGARVGQGCEVEGDVTIGRHTNFTEHIEAVGNKIEIGKFNAIARGATFQNRNHLMSKPAVQAKFYDEWFGDALEMPSKGVLSVGNDAWIGTRSLVLSGVKIGSGDRKSVV